MNMPGESIAQGDAPEVRTIVEIGAGRFGPADAIDGKPLWESTAERRTFDANEHYIGIDLGAKTIVPRPAREAGMTEADVNTKWKAMIAPHDRRMYANWARVRNEHPTENITFLHADATELPLPNESADEVIASNVFGRGAEGSVLPSMYVEAMRVLKPDGKFIIHDSVSPVFIGANSLSHWLRDNNLPKPSSTTWLNFRASHYAFVEAAQQYGLPYDKPWNDSPEEQERIKWSSRENTIWILGKAAATPVVAAEASAPEPFPDPAQPSAKIARSESPESTYERWKAAFGDLFNRDK